MDFAFTEEQELLRTTVREFCQKEISKEKVREWEETLDFMPQEVWDKAARLGLFAGPIPEEYGGDGIDMVTAMVAFEEVSPRLEAIARTLGAGEPRVLMTVTLPLAVRGIVAGLLLAFARALGEFGAPLLVAGNIPGRTTTIATGIYGYVQLGQDDSAFRLLAASVRLSVRNAEPFEQRLDG